MARFTGKVVVITGATSGIGLASAQLFAREGARLFITGRRQAELDAAVAAIGANAIGVRGDVSNLADLDRLYDVVRQEAGVIDVIFANAGGGSFMPLADITEDHYTTIFDTNVKGLIFTVQKGLSLLRDSGCIILTGSTTGSKGTPSFSVYSATKAAVRNFARSWILDLAPRGIRVNVLSPGAISTPGLHGLAGSEEQDADFQAMLKSATPSGRLGTASEIGQAALFLASEESNFVNGCELFVDGGMAQI